MTTQELCGLARSKTGRGYPTSATAPLRDVIRTFVTCQHFSLQHDGLAADNCSNNLRVEELKNDSCLSDFGLPVTGPARAEAPPVATLPVLAAVAPVNPWIQQSCVGGDIHDEVLLGHVGQTSHSEGPAELKTSSELAAVWAELHRHLSSTCGLAQDCITKTVQQTLQSLKAALSSKALLSETDTSYLQDIVGLLVTAMDKAAVTGQDCNELQHRQDEVALQMTPGDALFYSCPNNQALVQPLSMPSYTVAPSTSPLPNRVHSTEDTCIYLIDMANSNRNRGNKLLMRSSANTAISSRSPTAESALFNGSSSDRSSPVYLSRVSSSVHLSGESSTLHTGASQFSCPSSPAAPSSPTHRTATGQLAPPQPTPLVADTLKATSMVVLDTVSATATTTATEGEPQMWVAHSSSSYLPAPRTPTSHDCRLRVRHPQSPPLRPLRQGSLPATFEQLLSPQSPTLIKPAHKAGEVPAAAQWRTRSICMGNLLRDAAAAQTANLSPGRNSAGGAGRANTSHGRNHQALTQAAEKAIRLVHALAGCEGGRHGGDERHSAQGVSGTRTHSVSRRKSVSASTPVDLPGSAVSV